MARPDHTSRARGERRSQPLPPCCQAWVAEAARSWQVQARGARPDHGAADRGERAVVKGGTCPAQHAAVEQLGGAARPGELVGAVASPVADDERRDRHVGQDDPEQDRAGALPNRAPPLRFLRVS